MGTVTDRIGSKTTMVVSLILQVGSLAWLQFSNNLTGLYVFALFFGFGYGGLSCVQSLVTAEFYGLISLGVIVATMNLGYDIGGSFGPLAAGYIYDVSESYRVAFIFCLAMAVIALVTGLLLNPPQKKKAG